MTSFRYVCTISVSSEGVEIHLSGDEGLFWKKHIDRTLKFAWREVTRIVAYKRDCFAIDQICVEFQVNGTHVTEITEDALGWNDLIVALSVYLPGALSEDEWWSEVVLPPFEFCLKQLYLRPSDAPLDVQYTA